MFNEILPRMCDIDPALKIDLLVSNDPLQPLPTHSRIKKINLISTNASSFQERLWENFRRRAKEKLKKNLDSSADGKIWHSTYYTQPDQQYGAQVVTVYDMIYELYPEIFRGIGSDKFRDAKKQCILNADAVICISENTRNDLLNYYSIDASKVSVVYLGFNSEFRLKRKNLKESTEKPYILYVGSRAEYKGFNTLIEAYKKWPENNRIDLKVVGNNWSENEDKYLSELRIKDKVHLRTDVDDRNLADLYKKASAFVYPSLYEGFGIPLIESMACGCPVVASRIPSTVEVAGDCPIYFEPASVDDLVCALDLALNENKESERIRLGFQHVKKYSWDATASQTLKVYRTVNELTK